MTQPIAPGSTLVPAATLRRWAADCLRVVGMGDDDATLLATSLVQTSLWGVDSHGMLCSACDIGWTDVADGVLVVMPDSARVGDAAPAEPPVVSGWEAGRGGRKNSERARDGRNGQQIGSHGMQWVNVV